MLLRFTTVTSESSSQGIIIVKGSGLPLDDHNPIHTDTPPKTNVTLTATILLFPRIAIVLRYPQIANTRHPHVPLVFSLISTQAGSERNSQEEKSSTAERNN